MGSPRSARSPIGREPAVSANANWKSELSAILERHNSMHATRNKPVSHLTRASRSQGLYRSFNDLRTMGFRLSPAGLSERHIQWLMRYWTGHPQVATLPGDRSEKLVPRASPLSPAYIQQQLSFLRVFAGWIGKPGMVRPAEYYVDSMELVRRHYTARSDRSWSGNDLAAEQVIAVVSARDVRVGMQLELLLAFGLRRKEAVMFQPHLAEVPPWALPASFKGEQQYLAFIKVKRGTKGGRLRFTAVRTEAQRVALARARLFALNPDSHMGHPGLSLKQSLDRFTYIVRACGVTKAALGVTPHGLRHQFAGDLFFYLTHVPAPVRGGSGLLDPATLRDAYLEVARQLGHNRPPISNAYLGKPIAAKSAKAG